LSYILKAKFEVHFNTYSTKLRCHWQ